MEEERISVVFVVSCKTCNKELTTGALSAGQVVSPCLVLIELRVDDAPVTRFCSFKCLAQWSYAQAIQQLNGMQNPLDQRLAPGTPDPRD